MAFAPTLGGVFSTTLSLWAYGKTATEQTVSLKRVSNFDAEVI